MIDNYFLRRLFWKSHLFIDHNTYNRSHKFWYENKDILKGQRGFVVGNGPSLKINDLDKLKNEISIASNKIYLAFKETHWRPNFFTIADRLLWNKINKDLKNYFDRIIISSSFFNYSNDIEVIKMPLLGNWSGFHRKIGDNVLDGIYDFRTITITNLQIAMHLGLNPIYIIGCDHYYKGENENSESNSESVVGNQTNHFIKGYREKGESVNYAPIDIMTQGYDFVNDFATKNDFKIYNATRGGHLESFKRINFDSLL